MKEEVVVVSAKRTPMGSMLGCLSNETAPKLSAATIKAILNETHLPHDAIQEVILGCVLQAGIGQAPARQAAIFSGLSESVSATTINKMCGSGMKAVMFAHDLIQVGSANIVLAGGMESMSQAPYLLPKARQGYRLGHGELKDHMFLDGLEDAYDKGKLMGVFAEKTAEKYHFTRQMQDDFARCSLERALSAQTTGAFHEEIVPYAITLKNDTRVIHHDESPSAEKITKIAGLKPAFSKEGTVTAANSSSISDGAATLLLMSLKEARSRGLKPIAKIVAHSQFSHAPEWFTTAPVHAIRSVLDKAYWCLNDVSLFEINEAFAVVTMVAMHELGLNPAQVNIHGGACALGHPIGASGARILVTLIHALKAKGLQKGVASLCIGGGEATAMAIEVLS